MSGNNNNVSTSVANVGNAYECYHKSENFTQLVTDCYKLLDLSDGDSVGANGSGSDSESEIEVVKSLTLASGSVRQKSVSGSAVNSVTKSTSRMSVGTKDESADLVSETETETESETFEENKTSCSESNTSETVTKISLESLAEFNKQNPKEIGKDGKKKNPAMEKFQLRLIETDRLKELRSKGCGLQSITIPRMLDIKFKPQAIVGRYITGAEYSRRASSFITKTGEWAGKLTIPKKEEYINAVFLSYIWVTRVPTLAVISFVVHNREEIEGKDQLIATFQLLDRTAGAMPFPSHSSHELEQHIPVSVEIMSKLRNVSRARMLRQKNPDNSWNSAAVNMLIDLMKKDRCEAVARSCFQEQLGENPAMFHMHEACKSGETRLHVAYPDALC